MARSTKGLYKRGRIWWMTFNDALGQQRWESCKTTNKSEAEKRLIERRKEALEGIVPTPRAKPIGLKAFLDEYAQHVAHQRGVHTKHLHIQHLTRILGNPPIHTLTVKVLERYRDIRRSEGVGPATINRELATIKHALTKAASWKLIKKEQREELKGVQKDKEPPGRLRYLTNQEEEDRLLEGCRGRFKALVIIALHTGMRRGELLRLTWEDVDLEQGFIHIPQTKSGERRTLPMNETVWRVLTTLRVRHDIPWVFHDDEGRQYGYIRNIFLWACKRAKIRDFRFHDLRHTFASRLVMNGSPLATVSQLLGHKSILMTMRYAHLSPQHRMEAVRSLDKNMTISGWAKDLLSPKQPFERDKPCVNG